MGVLKNSLIASVGLLFAGCYENIDIPLESKPVLCLNSLITAGEKIEVSVTHTWDYSQEVVFDDIKVDDAIVEIYANDCLCDSDYIAEEGDRIRIYVTSAKYGEASAEVTVPYAVDFNVSNLRLNVVDRWKLPESVGSQEGEMGECRYLMMNVSADVEITDDSSAINYFEFRPYSKNFIRDILGIPDDDDNTTYYANSGYIGGDLQTDMEPIFHEHMDAFESMIGSTPYGVGFFTDRQFDGGSYTLHIIYKDARYWIRMQEYAPELLNVGYVFRLYTVSESYYNWSVYRWYTVDSGMSDLVDIGLSDAIWGYSNVSTGAGVVAAIACRSHNVDLSDLLKDQIDF